MKLQSSFHRLVTAILNYKTWTNSSVSHFQSSNQRTYLLNSSNSRLLINTTLVFSQTKNIGKHLPFKLMLPLKNLISLSLTKFFNKSIRKRLSSIKLTSNPCLNWSFSMKKESRHKNFSQFKQLKWSIAATFKTFLMISLANWKL